MDNGFPEKIRVGISHCLLGEHVRHDGGHKRSPLCTELLAQRFEFVPVCPEMGIGMGTPREPIHLVGRPGEDAVRAVGNRSPDLDVTEQLETHGREKAAELGELCGYIFMQRSPSCGLANIPLYQRNGTPLGRSTRGIYAREFTARHPLLPVEEESRLRDPRLYENFMTRVYAWQRWRALEADGMTPAALRDFHACHKYLLMARKPAAYRYLQRLLALAPQRSMDTVARDYIRVFMATLGRVANRHGHAQVLQQLAGPLEKRLNAPEHRELMQAISAYRRGRLPLSLPLRLLHRLLREHPDAWPLRQVYLQPYPPELRPDR